MKLQDEVINTGETQVEDTLLEGHLGITRELLSFQSAEKKFQMGSEKGGANLIKVLFFIISRVLWNVKHACKLENLCPQLYCENILFGISLRCSLLRPVDEFFRLLFLSLSSYFILLTLVDILLCLAADHY